MPHDNRDCRDCLANAAGEHELHGFFDAEVAGGEAALLQRCGYQRVRAFVFVPGEYVGLFGSVAAGDLFAGPVLFKVGGDVGGLAAGPGSP